MNQILKSWALQCDETILWNHDITTLAMEPRYADLVEMGEPRDIKILFDLLGICEAEKKIFRVARGLILIQKYSIIYSRTFQIMRGMTLYDFVYNFTLKQSKRMHQVYFKCKIINATLHYMLFVVRWIFLLICTKGNFEQIFHKSYFENSKMLREQVKFEHTYNS